MKFSHIFTVLAAALAVDADLTAQQVVAGLNELTTLATQIKSTVDQSTAFHGFFNEDHIRNRLEGFVNQAQTDLDTSYEGGLSQSYTIAQQTNICNAFSQMSSTLASVFELTPAKKRIFATIGKVDGMAALLRNVEGVVDNIASVLVNKVPSCAAEVTAQKNALDQAEQVVITQYAGGLP